MSKHAKTLTAIGTALAHWSNSVTINEIGRKAVLAQCEGLTLAEKQHVDGELVAYYAGVAGVEVRARDKAHPLFCGSAPAWERNDKGTVSHPAAMALSRARGVLFAVEKAASGGAGARVKKASTPKFTMETLLPSVGDFIESMGGEKISAAQKREVRQAAALLLSLVA